MSIAIRCRTAARHINVTCQRLGVPGRELALLVCFALLSAGAMAQNGPAAWVAPSLQRIGLHDLPGSGTDAQLSAGRGEYESFQIVVHAPAGVSLTNINVGLTDLTSSTGRTIPKSNLTLFREQYVYVSS